MIYYILAMIGGLLITVMVAINGELSAYYSLYIATVIIHVVGLTCVTVMLLIKKVKLKPPKKLPLFLYIGGMIGVLTTLFNNIAYARISVSALLAIGLFGQSLTSLVIDQTGWLGMAKKKFNRKKLIGIGFMVIGIVCITLL